MSSDDPSVVSVDPELVKLNPIAERGFAQLVAVLIKLGVPLPQLINVAIVNLLWLADRAENRAAVAVRLEAAAELLKRKEAQNGR